MWSVLFLDSSSTSSIKVRVLMRSLKVGEAVDLGIHEWDMLVGGMDGPEHTCSLSTTWSMTLPPQASPHIHSWYTYLSQCMHQPAALTSCFNEKWKCMESSSYALTNQVFCCRDPHQSSPHNGQTSVGSLRVIQSSHFSRRPRRSHQ